MKGYWIIGILLLIGSIVGVKMVMDQSSGIPNANKKDDDLKKTPDIVVCWGYFDVEKGVAILYPKQPGDIVMVKPEFTRIKDQWQSTRVKEGEVLLQVDDKVAKLKVREAENDIKAGQVQVAEAKQLIEQYKLQREQQAAAVASLAFEKKKIELERNAKLDQLDKGQPVRKLLEEMYGEALKELGEKKKAEEAKLKALGLLDAQLKVDLANADLDAKKTRLDQAKELLRHFQIVAPSDGIVLRTYVHKGETLGPMPRSQAIDFLPDGEVIVRAEVMQEWGRFVKEGQTVSIEDDTYHGQKWEGKVRSLSNWYAATRSPVIEPFRNNDVRTLECIIDVTGGEAKKLNGQRVRAKIKIPPPA